MGRDIFGGFHKFFAIQLTPLSAFDKIMYQVVVGRDNERDHLHLPFN